MEPIMNTLIMLSSMLCEVLSDGEKFGCFLSRRIFLQGCLIFLRFDAATLLEFCWKFRVR
jgi:hypothetical protein